MFSGSFVALVTPFKNGMVNTEALMELVDFQIANKTSGLVPCGTTGESATLSHDEHERVIEMVVRQARRRIPVIAGAGSNSTSESISLTKHAYESGADAVLSIVPYYNKPTQEGIFEHFAAIAKNVPIPIIIYNIPSRTGVNMLPSTLIRLAEKHKNIVGVKESSGNMDQITEILRSMDTKKFTVLSGDDSLTLPILAEGGKGVISVLANIAPKAVNELYQAFMKGNLKKAQELHYKTYPLIKTLFLETNPAPLKTAMEMMGLCDSEMRLPMCPLSDENKKALAKELRAFGLIR